MKKETQIKPLIQHLSGLVSENRKNKFNKIVQDRTRHITVVLEDIFQSQNASAVLRTCDIFGIQDVHVIENRNEYVINPDVELGSAKWLNLNRYNEEDYNTLSCINSLKEKGYKVVATSPHEKDCTIDNLSIDQPVALIFGTELTGISDVVKENADEFVRIPMFGFTESFNISVSAAICLNVLSNKMHNSSLSWRLNEKEQDEIVLSWLRNTVKNHKEIEEQFLENEN